MPIHYHRDVVERLSRQLEHMRKHTGQPPRELLCGPTFLLTIVRRSGSTETDEEILARFKDSLNIDGFYILKAQP